MPRRFLTRVVLVGSLLVVLHLIAGLPVQAATRKSRSKASHTSRPHVSRTVPAPSPEARAVLLKDAGSGQILYAFGADRRLAPASLTKIMTALVALEQGNLQEIVTISHTAAAAPRTRLDLHAGQRFVLGDLVQAMLNTSANDACRAVAEHVGGTEDEFVALMNARAEALQLLDTHFVNACGFDAPRHYSTAMDLARLSDIAMAHPLFQNMVKQDRGLLRDVDRGWLYPLSSTNRLLGQRPGVEGVKTGFTNNAGPCLVAKVSEGSAQLLLVLLHAKPRWQMAHQLIEQGLALLARERLMPAATPSFRPAIPLVQ